MDSFEHTLTHRSIRSVPVCAAQLAAAGVVAAFASAVVVLLGNSILSAHNWLCSATLWAAGVEVVAVQPASLYRIGFLAVDGLLIEASSRMAASGYAVGAVTALIVLLAAFVGWRWPFLRGVAVCSIVVIGVAVATATYSPPITWTTTHFTRLWLRVELAVWVIVPWLMAYTLVFRTGVGARLISAIAVIESYLICWSAIRMAAGIACVATAGAGAVPVVFFVIGPICDLLSLIVFYSLALR
jgi:hypothetical protein